VRIRLPANNHPPLPFGLTETGCQTMQVNFNSQPVDCPPAGTLLVLLDTLGLSARKGIAVAHNSQIIPRARWGQTLLQENDSITVLQATQGG
jgi:sulfur carrier protein